MTTATIEVDFANLNTLATNLRSVGAKFYVEKVENFWRISFKEAPKLASVADIISYTQGLVAEAEVAAINDDEPALATPEQLEALSYHQLKALAKTYEIAGYHKAKKVVLVEALAGKVLASEIA
ncbi:hypothetical protein [Merismopedia glauca]|uniref:Uncharacterized protein n=1 Tax=Merismopedia glauca CCAP 1448/3 TaxID=1296344 RepID=A0A2T1BWN4_9CYAN|nr:hypothetical protein [Merismopedia glauca]PSB00411.1 hypothetical protein C7B64_23675 [Merismopedia glauca CCAP 1448/3]